MVIVFFDCKDKHKSIFPQENLWENPFCLVFPSVLMMKKK